MGILKPEVECASRSEMKALQTERLKKMVKNAYDNVPFYKQKLDEAGVSPDDIKSIDDIVKLPFTLKTDLRDNYPYGLFAVPNSELVRVHASSGTTGKQTVVGYTKNDIDVWAESAARAIVATGGSKDDIVHVSYGYGLFTGGLGLHYGAEWLGATAIPVSTGNTARQLQIFQDFGSTVLCCTPSYALYLGEYRRDNNIPLENLKLRAGIFGAEPWTDEMRKQIEELLGIEAYDIYGLSEIAGPGVSFDCECHNGMHVNEDYFYPEVIDPETLEVLPDGEVGELVFTCIGKEALPLIRYRTRDLCSLTHEKCACGRTTVRMSKPVGRSDDMLIIRGVNVFPSQIEHVLLSQGMQPNYIITVDRVNNLDTLTVDVEMSAETFSDTVKDLETARKKLEGAMQSTLNVHASIRFVEYGSLPRSEGKAKRVIDKRKIK
ncbi:MAG: phenylacetate--CoA ligase [Ruminococcaceae bacterium]|nr:phenylacetate--CoA ligase [Oscillospiraceae bacterium]